MPTERSKPMRRRNGPRSAAPSMPSATVPLTGGRRRRNTRASLASPLRSSSTQNRSATGAPAANRSLLVEESRSASRPARASANCEEPATAVEQFRSGHRVSDTLDELDDRCEQCGALMWDDRCRGSGYDREAPPHVDKRDHGGPPGIRGWQRARSDRAFPGALKQHQHDRPAARIPLPESNAPEPGLPVDDACGGQELLRCNGGKCLRISIGLVERDEHRVDLVVRVRPP